MLVCPTEVPWDLLTDAHLEEMLHWLLHEMGAKDLVWRKGGRGGGAADQGRDLEATFHVPSPSGEIDVQRWWVEAKGRSRTVEPAAVKEAVLSAAGRPDVDVLVVATNSQFSNPTRDWVTDWQKTHARPRVQLWERASLERMLSKHPAVAARLFPRALTPQGHLEFAEKRFWNLLTLPDQATLGMLWEARTDLEISAPAMLALLVGEHANGDLSAHPWLAALNRDDLLEVLGIAFHNSVYLLKASSDRGTSFDPIAGALERLLGCALLHCSGAELARFVEACWRDRGFAGDLSPVQEILLGPIVNGLAAEMFEACTCDCPRVYRSAHGRANRAPSLWNEFVNVPADAEKKDNRVLILVGYDAPCRMGFSLTKDDTCPLYDLDAKKGDLAASLEKLQRVMRQRVAAVGGVDPA